MKDYIEREQAITVFKTFYGKSLRVVLEALGEEHAADVRSVVRATWVRCNRGAGFKCSVCKARVSNGDVVHGNHHFCYKCGAMMEES